MVSQDRMDRKEISQEKVNIGLAPWSVPHGDHTAANPLLTMHRAAPPIVAAGHRSPRSPGQRACPTAIRSRPKSAHAKRPAQSVTKRDHSIDKASTPCPGPLDQNCIPPGQSTTVRESMRWPRHQMSCRGSEAQEAVAADDDVFVHSIDKASTPYPGPLDQNRIPPRQSTTARESMRWPRH